MLTAILCAFALLGAACSSDDDAASDESAESSDGSNSESSAEGQNPTEDEPAGATPKASEVYADPANWLCRPDVDGDACDIDLDATLIAADGTQTVEPFVAATDAPVDCIYYYPTISTDPGPNADRVPDGPEQGIVANQAARLAEVCNLYAPMYRQVPLATLFGGSDEGDDEESSSRAFDPDDPDSPGNIAYSDVRESFMHYLAEDNDGRPFVLVGHSQGSGHLARLIAEEIDGNEQLTDQMLSAMLIGSGVVIDGGVEGGIENIGACESPTETSCIVSYATFYESEPPDEDSLFGRSRSGDGRVVCTNPAALGGGAAYLSSYFQAGFAEGTPEVSTPWVHFTELVEGECLSNEEFDWMEVRVTEAPSYPADLGGRVGPGWGTHLADVNFTMGDLVELVRSQSKQD